MTGKSGRVLGVCGVLVVVVVGSFMAYGPFGHDEFCPAYAVGASLVDDERVRVGDKLILDHSYRERDPCQGDDLWH